MKPRTPTPAPTRLATICSGSSPLGSARTPLSVIDDLGQPEGTQHVRRRLRGSGLDLGDGPGPGAHVTDGPLRHESALAHHAEVGADLLDLGQQMAGDEDGGPVGGERGDERTHLPGSLRVESVGRLVEQQQVARREQRRRDREPLAHAQRVGAVALARGREQPDPLECGIDPRARRRRVGVPISRVEPGEVRSAGEVGMERRALHQRSHPGQHAARPVRGCARRAPRSAPRWRWTSPRSMRMVVVLPEPFGPRKPYTAPCGTSRSMPSTAAWSPNRLVRPTVAMAAEVTERPGPRSGSSDPRRRSRPGRRR